MTRPSRGDQSRAHIFLCKPTIGTFKVLGSEFQCSTVESNHQWPEVVNFPRASSWSFCLDGLPGLMMHIQAVHIFVPAYDI